MKDKRQRMALAWPFGIADPAIFTYLANAASSPFSPYPYALSGAAMPINHYASLGLHRAAAAYHPYGHGLRPAAELLSHSSPLPRAPLPGEHLANLVAAQSPLTSGLPTCNIARDQSLLMTSHPAARGLPTSCLSPRLAEPLNCHLDKDQSLADRKPIIIKPKASKSQLTDSAKPTKPTIFRPFGTDE